MNLFIVLVIRERGGKDNLGGEIVGAKARRQSEPGHMQEAGRGWPGGAQGSGGGVEARWDRREPWRAQGIERETGVHFTLRTV